jgi:hypothetical protein
MLHCMTACYNQRSNGFKNQLNHNQNELDHWISGRHMQSYKWVGCIVVLFKNEVQAFLQLDLYIITRESKLLW